MLYDTLHYMIALNLKLFFVLIAFGFIIGQTRQIAVRNISDKKLGNFLLDIFNLAGTPVHELGHLFFAVLFGYKIDQVSLFSTMKKSKKNGGTLGFVKMHHEGTSFLSRLQRDMGQFFIGIGPLLMGPLIIFIFSRLLPERIRSLPVSFRTGFDSFIKALHQLSATDIMLLFVFLYFMAGISLNMELSRQDMEMALKGVFFLEILFLLLAFTSSVFQLNLDYGINILFRWNLIISCTGIISSLIANLIALL